MHGHPANANAFPSSRALVERGPCKCFSICSHEGLQDFIHNRPSIIDRNDSAWYAYLHAVYNGEVLLPFNLSAIRFVYHNSAEWQRKHPETELPWPSCVAGALHFIANLRQFNMSEMPEAAPWCSAQSCRRWRQHDARVTMEAAARAVKHVEVYHTARIVHRELHTGIPSHWESAGVRWVERADLRDAITSTASMQRSRPHAASCSPAGSSRWEKHDGLWLEVMRRNSEVELSNGGGMWFAIARGSGIWLHASRPWHLNGPDPACLRSKPCVASIRPRSPNACRSHPPTCGHTAPLHSVPWCSCTFSGFNCAPSNAS